MKGLLTTTCLVASIFACQASAFAESIVIYRWVDENNVVHFSQHQPNHDNYIMINTADKQPTKKAQDDALIPELANSNSSSAAESDSLTAKLNDRCEEAKRNVETLQKFEQVQITDSKGEIKMISGQEKAEQIIIAQKQVEVYCE